MPTESHIKYLENASTLLEIMQEHLSEGLYLVAATHLKNIISIKENELNLIKFNYIEISNKHDLQPELLVNLCYIPRICYIKKYKYIYVSNAELLYLKRMDTMSSFCSMINEYPYDINRCRHPLGNLIRNDCALDDIPEIELTLGSTCINLHSTKKNFFINYECIELNSSDYVRFQEL